MTDLIIYGLIMVFTWGTLAGNQVQGHGWARVLLYVVLALCVVAIII